MRKIAHGIIYFEDKSVKQRVDELMVHQSSAVRSAYQAIHKHGLKNNDVKIYVKKNYMELLNQTYIADSVSNAKQINQQSAIFGGKRNWKKLQTSSLSKSEWLNIRNNQLYATGDKSHNGNRNIRIDLTNNKILINDPSKHGKWLEADLFFPKKFSNPNLDCYNVRIIRRNNRYEFNIGWDEEPIPKIPIVPGAIGIDTNPDGLALAETDSKGNLVKHLYFSSQRIQFARKNKRKYDVSILAKNIIDYALKVKKMIVLEKLAFKTKTGLKTYKKSNRMKHNFMFRQLVDAILSRAEKYGVPTKLVNPGYTSIIGILKYQDMYKLNRHTAAALVIARRGMEIKEKQTFSATKIEYETKVKVKPKLKINNPKKVCYKIQKTVGVNLEGRNQSQFLKTEQSWEWMTQYLKHPQIAEVTPPSLELRSIEDIINCSIDEKHKPKVCGQVLKTGQTLYPATQDELFLKEKIDEIGSFSNFI